MNLHPIITPNLKGQLIIPVAIRKSLQLSPTTPLEVQAVGNHIVLKPIKNLITADADQSQYLDALKQTAGSWSQDSLPNKHQLEIKAVQRRRDAW